MGGIKMRIADFIRKRRITFDDNGNAVISKTKLVSIILQAKLGESFYTETEHG